MNYYTISLLRSSAPVLTYSSTIALEIGTVVQVPLKTTIKDAVIIKQVEKPEFDTAEIVSVTDKIYSTEQMEIAKFISEYYFSSFSEAISLFLPYRRGRLPSHQSNDVYDDDKIPNINGVMAIAPYLSEIQQKAHNQLLKKDRALLFGVTGSGKTEIFISLMFKMMEEGKTSIFLMPEISLTPQMEEAFKGLFWRCCRHVAL